MRERLVRSVTMWLPFLVAITALAGLAYGLDQQDLRQGADDPQTQMAEDAAARLGAGAPVSAVVPRSTAVVDIASSLAPFVIVYDRNDRPLAATGVLDGTAPTPPQGVTASARDHEDHVTWQPRSGVRIAAVLVAYNGGTVLAGRSLRVAEQREDDALGVAAAGWLAALVLTWLAIVAADLASERFRPRRAR
jgi:hypothetical protein